MGYIHPEASNEQECVDINECDMFDNLCVFGRCENKEGSFQCICDPGYILDSSGGNCTGQIHFSTVQVRPMSLLFCCGSLNSSHNNIMPWHSCC
jgi:Calcium-binding EGF domain